MRYPCIKLFKGRRFWLVILQVVFLSVSLFAQQRKEEDFSKLFFGVAYSPTLNTTGFNDYYKQPSFIGVQIGTNYLHGLLKADVSYAKVSSKTTIPSFTLTGFQAGYDYRFNLLKDLEWLNGFALGVAYMNFDDPTISDNLKQETEMLLKLNSTFQYRIGKHLAIGAGAEWARIYTHKRIDFINAKVQISYYLTNAQTLKRWME